MSDLGVFMNLEELIKAVGYVGIFAIIFAESGLLIGFFLPGDSLLFTAGFLAYTGVFSLPVLLIGCAICAIAGDSVGYWFGRRVGRRLFQREDSRFFHKKNLLRAQAFYEQHGTKTIVLARFMPIVRTFAPIVAGVGDMHYRTFVTFNIVGGLLWSLGVTTAGYFFGQLIPRDKIDNYLLPIIILIVAVSLAPSVYHVLKEPENRASLMGMLRRNNNAKPPVDVQSSPVEE
jgi:membrane-associated protein